MSNITKISTIASISPFTLNKVAGYSLFAFLQKRIIDLTIGGSLLICCSPVMLYVIYRIKKESKGPILFKQSRIGLNGEPFYCYKFRSMHIQRENTTYYTQDHDPRIFPFGLLMRKMRIDELPQLWNVIKGEMHLVGPRAEWDILVHEYQKEIHGYHNRHNVRPGITGLAQVLYPYGRGVKDARKKLKYDLIYINKWSLGLELKIIWKTIKIVLAKKGV